MVNRRVIYHRYQIAASMDRVKIANLSLETNYQPKNILSVIE
jgi:hypothetical protein